MLGQRHGTRSAIVLMLAALGITGCAGKDNRIARLKDGASKVLEAPPCNVKSTTRVGQQWVEETKEGGKSALGWKLSTKPCPGEPKPVAAAKKPEPSPATVVPAPAKKIPWWRRFRDRA